MDAHGNVRDTVTVVVETKGCWNTDSEKDMKDQLTERYLRTSIGSAGIYLVGWFKCPQWNASDPRRKRTARLDLGTLRERLIDQAKRISVEQGVNVSAFVLDCSLP